MNVFDLINSVSHNKKDLSNEVEFDKQYVPFVVNKALSYHLDTLMYANAMNMLHELDKEVQYSFYLNILRPRKRYAKWIKVEKDEQVDLISSCFKMNHTKSKAALELLSIEQLAILEDKKA